MIRPFTCLCMLMAGGAGLYLYQEKHRTEMLDREIGRVIRQTEAQRAQTSALKAEWQVRNEPGRLADLAARFLSLKPMAPTQFVQLAALGARLPAVGPMPAAAAEPSAAPTGVPMADAAPAAATLVASRTGEDEDAEAAERDAPAAPEAAVASSVPAAAVASAPAAAASAAGAAVHPHAAEKPVQLAASHPHHAAERPIEMQIARTVDAGHATSAYAHGGMLPLAAPRPPGAGVIQAMARPMARPIQPARASYVGSSLGGATALPPPVPYSGE